MSNFLRRLRCVRETLYLRPEAAAAALGISVSWISRIEDGQNGHRADSRENLGRYCLWLAEQATLAGRGDLDCRPEALCPDVFVAVTK
jgi:transcriptional regulator with XRE-family HTH domain